MMLVVKIKYKKGDRLTYPRGEIRFLGDGVVELNFDCSADELQYEGEGSYEVVEREEK